MSEQEQSISKMGRGMWYIAWGIGLILLALFFADIEQGWQNPNEEVRSLQAEGYSEVILQRNRYGHYVASGFINNKPVTFLLDTGASHVAVPKNLAREIGLPFGPEYKTMTANGIGRSFATRIESLSLGDISFRDVRGGITDNMPGEQVLLGMSALKQLEFTQRGDTLILRQYH